MSLTCHKPATWDVLDLGRVPAEANTVEFSCPNCGHEAVLPLLGRPLAQLNRGGIVFDNDCPHALPKTIRCRRCRRKFEAV